MDNNLIIQDRIVKGYKEKGIITVEIPEGIVAISDNAFSNFPNLCNIKFPHSLVMIGNNSFKNCPKLKNIDLTNVCSIGVEAFSNCTSLESLTFGKEIYYLPNAAFLGCVALTEVKLPENITYIGCECFKDCTSLVDIDMSGVMEIDNNAFEHCSELYNLTLPTSLFHISSNAFSFCEKLSTVIIQNRFVDIDESAFEHNVNFVIKAVQYSTSQNFAHQLNYKYQPIIVDGDYRMVSDDQLDTLSTSNIMVQVRKINENENLIHYDKSATSRIVSLIGGENNV